MKGMLRYGSLFLMGMVALPGLAGGPVDVVIPTNLNGATASDIVVPISLDPSSGIVSMDLTFQYDAAVLAATDVFRTSATDGFALAFDLGVGGTVSLQLSSITPLASSESEEVAWVTFEALGTNASQSDLVWTRSVLNGGAVPSVNQDGRVSIQATAAVIEMPDDALGPPGDTLVVPILINDVTDAESFDLIARYNPLVIDATGVDKTTLTQSMSLTTFLGAPGEVRISLFGIAAISGGGPLVEITFDLVGSFEDQTPLDLSKGVINEGVIASSLDDGLLGLCDPVDTDDDGFSGCEGDCETDDPEINPDATEVCDGIDNDCDGIVDSNVPPPAGTPALLLGKNTGDGVLEWDVVAGATGYDVVRGDLAPLRASLGDYTTSVESCLENDTPATTRVDPDLPGSGDSFWYLIRSVNCGGDGSYDVPEPSQAAPRDASIDGSGLACP